VHSMAGDEHAFEPDSDETADQRDSQSRPLSTVDHMRLTAVVKLRSVSEVKPARANGNGKCTRRLMGTSCVRARHVRRGHGFNATGSCLSQLGAKIAIGWYDRTGSEVAMIVEIQEVIGALGDGLHRGRSFCRTGIGCS